MAGQKHPALAKQALAHEKHAMYWTAIPVPSAWFWNWRQEIIAFFFSDNESDDQIARGTALHDCGTIFFIIHDFFFYVSSAYFSRSIWFFFWAHILILFRLYLLVWYHFFAQFCAGRSVPYSFLHHLVVSHIQFWILELHILVSCFVSFPRPPFFFRYFGRAVPWRDPIWSNYQAETLHERAKLKWKKGVGKTHHVVNIGCDNLLVKPMLWTWWWAASIIIHNLLYGPPFHANFWIGNFPFHVTWVTFGVKSLYILELGVKAAIALFTCIP